MSNIVGRDIIFNFVVVFSKLNVISNTVIGIGNLDKSKMHVNSPAGMLCMSAYYKYNKDD